MIALLFATSLLIDSAYYDQKGWLVQVGEHHCTLGTLFDNGRSMLVQYDATSNAIDLVIIDPAFRQESQGKKYNLELVFTNSNGLDDGWGKVDATAIKIGQKIGLQFVLNAGQVFDDLAHSTAVALLNRDVVLTGVSLRNSAPAVRALQECSQEVRQLRPSDPLAGLEKK